MFWVLLAIISVLLVYFKFGRTANFWKEEGVPYLKSWPIFGNMLPFMLRKMSLYHLIEKMYNSSQSRYLGFYQFTKPILMIRDVDLAKQICIKDFEHFIDHQSFFNETNEAVFSENLFAAKGQRWRDLRATLSPVFTGSKMRAMFMLMSQCSDRFIDYFSKLVPDDKPYEVEMKDIFKRFTIDVIGTCAYGVESNSLVDPNNEFYNVGQGVSNFDGIRGLKCIGFMMCPNLMRSLKISLYNKEEIEFFRSIITKTIEYREKHNIVRPDFIHIMMQARKGQLKYDESTKYSDTGFATIEESEVGKNANVKLDITDDLIIAQAMVFFLGGTDTTSMLLSFTAYELAINVDIQQKLQNEIDQAYVTSNGKITYEHVANMKYLDMVVTESLRKWPEAYIIDRLCDKDYTVKPTQPGEKTYVIKKGTVIWCPVVGFHFDAKYFPNPEKFDPERFSDNNKNHVNPYAYLPFGQGPRSCIGNRFALLVTKTILFNFLHKFNIVVTKKTDVPLKISTSQIILNSANGFWMGIQKRKT